MIESAYFTWNENSKIDKKDDSSKILERMVYRQLRMVPQQWVLIALIGMTYYLHRGTNFVDGRTVAVGNGKRLEEGVHRNINQIEEEGNALARYKFYIGRRSTMLQI